MTYSLPSDHAWCDRHRQPAPVCAAETRCCEHGRTRPLEPSWIFDDEPSVAEWFAELDAGPPCDVTVDDIVAVVREGRGEIADCVSDSATLQSLPGSVPTSRGPGTVAACTSTAGEPFDCGDSTPPSGAAAPGPSPAAVTDGGRETEGGPDPLHLSIHTGDVWVCWCGATHDTPWGHP